MPAIPAAARWQPDARGRPAAAPASSGTTAWLGQGSGTPAMSPARERGRRTVVRLGTLLLLLAILEGAMRKWVAPQLGAYVFFLRDLFLLLTHLVATLHSLWPRPDLFFQISLGLAFSASRGMVIQCGLSVLVAMLTVVVGRGGALKGRAFVWPAGLTVLALLANPAVFLNGYAAFSRALHGLIDFIRRADTAPLLGNGMGFGGNAASTLDFRGESAPPPYAETDFARQMIDVRPIFGLVNIALRFAFAACLSLLALRATRSDRDPMLLLLWSYVASVTVTGQLTWQKTVNFLGWLFAGLLITASKAPAGLLKRSRAPAERGEARAGDALGASASAAL